jgi:hypothetical protein
MTIIIRNLEDLNCSLDGFSSNLRISELRLLCPYERIENIVVLRCQYVYPAISVMGSHFNIILTHLEKDGEDQLQRSCEK